jgi:hypothetical protein
MTVKISNSLCRDLLSLPNIAAMELPGQYSHSFGTTDPICHRKLRSISVSVDSFTNFESNGTVSRGLWLSTVCGSEFYFRLRFDNDQVFVLVLVFFLPLSGFSFCSCFLGGGLIFTFYWTSTDF